MFTRSSYLDKVGLGRAGGKRGAGVTDWDLGAERRRGIEQTLWWAKVSIVDAGSRIRGSVIAGHGAGGTAVIDAPDGVDGFLIGHQQCGRVSLIDFGSTGGDDRLSLGLFGKIDERQLIGGL